MIRTLSFYLRYSWFHVREQFEGFTASFAMVLTFPFYVWILAWIWSYFNSYQGNFTWSQVICYVTVTELLFFSFLRPVGMGGRAHGDFSIALARPRNWLALNFASLYGKILTQRLIYCVLSPLLIPIVGRVPMLEFLTAVGRLLVLLPWITVVAVLMTGLFVSSKVFWEQTDHFVLPFNKIFLALGGVIGPLSDFSEPWKSLLIRLPSSDWFFQVGYYAVKGEFYGMRPGEWMLRLTVQILTLFALNLAFFSFARKHHQSYGG